MTLDELNTLPPHSARTELLKCCGSARWAVTMSDRRPFATVAQLEAVAEAVWWSLKSEDWLEAFSHHPRIGERAAADGWAKEEQAGTSSAAGAVLATLAKRNEDYERKFGHVFLIFASGKSADEMLAALESRIRNTPEEELKNAAAEQVKITRLRLEKLLQTADPSSARAGARAPGSGKT